MLLPWDKLPDYMRNKEVKPYYDSLSKKKLSLVLKRVFDVGMSIILLCVLSPIFVILAIWIKCDSKGPVIFKQERITRYGRIFKIYKFRTMVTNAEKLGSQVTSDNDMRVTKVGKKIRSCRLDELPQLINIIKGEMSFVGTRPEVPRYVKHYTSQMYATLLLPAGVTSMASINFKDEDKMLKDASNVDEVYVSKVLPEKMKYNLTEISQYKFRNDILTMVKTVIKIF